MKCYFAGNAVSHGAEERFVSIGTRRRLLSYVDADGWGRNAFDYWLSDRAPNPFFLDSGAFGALTRGVHIDLDVYCDFVTKHRHRVDPVACLDVIGDWKATARNWDVMRKRGLEVMPTFHMGSPDHELHRLCKETNYLALGGVVGATEEMQRPWMDHCWLIIKNYWPIKVHVFGVMAGWCLERYPWYSADSSSALVGAGMGSVITFSEGRLSAMSWPEYAQATYDGSVVDTVSHLQVVGGSAFPGRRIINIMSFLALERHITDVWTQRGVVWD